MSKKSSPKITAYKRNDGKIIAVTSDNKEIEYSKELTKFEIDQVTVMVNAATKELELNAKQVKKYTAKIEKKLINEKTIEFDNADKAANQELLNTARNTLSSTHGIDLNLVSRTDLRLKGTAFALHKDQMNVKTMYDTLGPGNDKANVYIPALIAVTDVMQAINTFLTEKKVNLKVTLEDLRKLFIVPSPDKYSYKNNRE